MLPSGVGVGSTPGESLGANEGDGVGDGAGVRSGSLGMPYGDGLATADGTGPRLPVADEHAQSNVTTERVSSRRPPRFMSLAPVR